MSDSTTAVKHGIYLATEAGPVPVPNAALYANDTEYDADDVASMVTGIAQQDKRINELMERNRALGNEMQHLRNAVRSALSELVDDGDLDKEKANEALEALGIDGLAVQYTATIIVEYEVSCESTEDADAVADMLRESDFEMNVYSADLGNVDVGTPNVQSVDVEVDE